MRMLYFLMAQHYQSKLNSQTLFVEISKRIEHHSEHSLQKTLNQIKCHLI